MYRNGTIWRKQYSLVKEASGCFMLFEFLPVVLKSGSFKPGGRLSAKSKRLFWLRALSGPLFRIGFVFFFSTTGRYSSVNIGDFEMWSVLCDSIPLKMEVFCLTGWSVSIGTVRECLFIVMPMVLALGKCSIGVVAIIKGRLVEWIYNVMLN